MHQQAPVEELLLDAHRERGGPFTAGSALVRRIIARTQAVAPELVRAHALTLASVVPELADHVPVADAIVRSFAFSREGNARGWTRRIAHGLAEVAIGYAARVSDGPCSIVFENVEHADPTDRELLAVLARRAPRDRLTVVSRVTGPAAPPAVESITSLLESATRSMHLAYYDAALERAQRGRRLLASRAELDGRPYGELTRHALFALLLLGRHAEAEALCAEIRAASRDPALLAHAAYAMAILHARLYAPAERDYDAAASWIATSLAFSESVPPSEMRAVNRAFLQNTQALVDLRRGRPGDALQRLTAALDYLAAEAPGSFDLECGILFHNRARVLVVLGDDEAAIRDFTTLLHHEPSSSSACFDRAIVHERAGRFEDALRDYAAAIAWSPPFPEPHVNRAQLLDRLGRTDEALAEYDYALELEPDLAIARLNRAYLSLERHDLEGARADAAEALRLGPPSSRLSCLQGLLALQRRDLDAAERAFDQALERDPSSADAHANRAAVRYERGELEGALADLDAALALREDAIILANRARVLEAQRRWADAVADYTRALRLAGEAPKLLRRRERCLRALDGNGP